MKKIYKKKLIDAQDLQHRAGFGTISKSDVDVLANGTLPSYSEINGKRYLAMIREQYQAITKGNLNSSSSDQSLNNNTISQLLK